MKPEKSSNVQNLFEQLVKKDWLAAFQQYSSYGEASSRLMWWVGVSTMASVLQRKVWLDMGDWEWSPNFYILVIGEQGVVRKSTSIDVGLNLARLVPGVLMGPSSATWQAFIDKLEEANRRFALPSGEMFEMCCLTLGISEFGTFFKPEDREQTDVLTDLWDGKKGTWTKATRTVASNTLTNPWINMIAGTTPAWMARNMSADELGGGLVSRIIFLREDMPEIDIPYPKLHMPPYRQFMKDALLERLCEIGSMAGEFGMTGAALEWGTDWYTKERNELRKGGLQGLEAGFRARKQVHLHKLAMILAAAEGKMLIDAEHLVEANSRLHDIEADAHRALNVVKQTEITGDAMHLVGLVRLRGHMKKRELFRHMITEGMDWQRFQTALENAVRAGYVLEADSEVDPIIVMSEKLR